VSLPKRTVKPCALRASHAAHCRVLKVGQVTVAIDGTKVLANASKHAAVSCGYAEEKLNDLEMEIKELLA